MTRLPRLILTSILLTTGAARAADTVVQIPLPGLLDGRSVTTLTGGKLVVWTVPTDGGGLQNGYITIAGAKLQNAPDGHALPDDGRFPANARHPEVVLHFSNAADATAPQTRLVKTTGGTFNFAVPAATYSKLFLFFTGAAGGTMVTMTLTYEGGTTEKKTAMVPDYYANISATDPVIFNLASDLAKWDKNSKINEADHHNLTGVELTPMASKTLTSVQVERATNGYLLFWGATGIATSALTTDGGADGAAPPPDGGGTGGTTGAAGTTGVAGTTGAAGTTGVAGTTGAAGTMAAPDPIAEARLALANLDNFSWTKSCKFSDNGKDVTVLSGCQAADICWETADLGRTYETRNIQINGVAGHRYQFDLRLRGVIEPRDYPVAPNCTRLPNMPADTVGVSECADGFANKAQVTFNVMELSIPNPAKKYYFNTVRVHPPHRVDLADWKWNVTVAANQSLKFTYDDLNGGMIRNCNKSINGADVVVKQQPFNGQWLQLNVDYASVKVLE